MALVAHSAVLVLGRLRQEEHMMKASLGYIETLGKGGRRREGEREGGKGKMESGERRARQADRETDRNRDT